MTNATCGQPDEKFCVCCNGTDDTPANPLVVLASKSDEEEFIHLRCARADSRFGFCWCCRDSLVYYSDDINDADECETHEGESVLDYPEEDAESYIENVRNNEGD
ncbi:hypothetical protein OKW49_004220 [Paraburkholderia youngii]|uniref:hypothetical protein n=1 Tax=Paraburkholderia youngii TaxID=2782701 RepID=UPI003D1D0670